MVSVSLFAIWGTLPLTMTYFNQMSFVGVVANLLVVPVIGFCVVPLGLIVLVHLAPVVICCRQHHHSGRLVAVPDHPGNRRCRQAAVVFLDHLDANGC